MAAVDEVRSAYAQAYRDSLVVTGRDHPEHLSLYGARSAMDIRVRGLRPDQVQFLVKGFSDRRIRVKDFSSEAGATRVRPGSIASAARWKYEMSAVGPGLISPIRIGCSRSGLLFPITDGPM